jgi:hypothetical protein
MAGQKAQADITGTQAKAAADFALANERRHNTMSTVHDMYQDFTQPPDNPPGVVQPPTPEQMSPDMALAHQVADLAQKHADIRSTRAKAAHTAVQAAHTAIGANRLAQTPIPQPQPQGPPQAP